MAGLPALGDVIRAIEKAASDAVGQDISTMQGFSRQQLLDIGQLTIDVAEMIDDGEFDDDPDEQARYLRMLKNLSINFTKTMVALSEVIIQKAWNAIVDVIWKVLGDVAGVALPRL